MLSRNRASSFALIVVLMSIVALVAVACSSAPAPGLDEAQLRSIVTDAVAQSAPAPQPQVTAAEIQSMVESSMQSAMMDAGGSDVSAEEIQAMVQAAVEGAASEGATPEQIRAMVESAVNAATADAVTGADVQSAITMAVSDSQAGMLTSEDIQSAVQMATEGQITAAQVQQIVDRAVATPEPAMMMGDEPTYGGTIRMGVTDQGTLDPMLAGLSAGQAPYGELTYDNATMYWYDGEVTPWAAESWSSTADLSQYTLKVRDGITFHSGDALTSADIKFTLDRIRADDSASPLKGQISYIDTIDTPDDSTVVLNLGASNAFLLGDLTDYHVRIVRNGVANDELTDAAHGSGPYTLGEHNPTERTVFHKYPDYWREGRPYSDQFIFFYMPEQVTRTEALKTGAIDVVPDPVISTLGSFAGNPEIRIAETPSAGVAVIDMHTAYSHLQGDEENWAKFQGLPDSLYVDKNLRKGMQYAVDRDFLVNAVQFGRGSPANDHPVGVNDQYYWDEQPIVKQDIARAKEYLAAAGYPDGVDVVLHTAAIGQMQEMALAFKESVAAAGINIKVTSHDTSTYWEAQWMDPCCPFVTSNWGSRPANAAIDVQLRSSTVWNESFYNNSRLDELLDLAASSPDLDERKEYFREMQEILIEDVPVLYLMYIPVIIAHRDNVGGVQAHAANAHFLMEEWWVQ